MLGRLDLLNPLTGELTFHSMLKPKHDKPCTYLAFTIPAPSPVFVPGRLPGQGYLLGYQLFVKNKLKNAASETEQIITSHNQLQI